VKIYDIATLALETTVAVTGTPGGIAISPDGSVAYVTRSGADAVSIIDTSTQAVSSTVAVGDFPIGVAFSPNGEIALVTNQSSDDVTTIDVATGTSLGSFGVGGGPSAVAITPDGAWAYVANLWDKTVSVVALTVLESAAPAAGSFGSLFSMTVPSENATSFALASGALPAGVLLNAATGVISGTPTVSGTFNFTITATGDYTTTTRAYQIQIAGLAETGVSIPLYIPLGAGGVLLLGLLLALWSTRLRRNHSLL
ncbi:MAG: putative Ig domain-containing protein, partial [Microbacteriaceae bacterium]|nr:putative Ig domain-containing protein [Microbacteriaceae bacterium]